MADILSLMKLHLRYRLWISEMNEDITALRIFEDHLNELAAKNSDAATQAFVSESKTRFNVYRKEIDELKHDMHLHKMNLAAQLREEVVNENDTTSDEGHAELRNRYSVFREKFDKAKQEFIGS